MIRGCQERGAAGDCIEVSHAVDPAITLPRNENPEEPKTGGASSVPARLLRFDKPYSEEEHLD